MYLFKCLCWWLFFLPHLFWDEPKTDSSLIPVLFSFPPHLPHIHTILLLFKTHHHQYHPHPLSFPFQNFFLIFTLFLSLQRDTETRTDGSTREDDDEEENFFFQPNTSCSSGNTVLAQRPTGWWNGLSIPSFSFLLSPFFGCRCVFSDSAQMTWWESRSG